MALREKLTERSQPHLEPGEQIQQAFWGQTGPSPWFIFLTVFWIKYRIVVVTDRRIVVVASRKLKLTPTGEMVASLPRATPLGPLHGLWAATHATGERLWVHKRFHKDVAAADAAIGASAARSRPPPAVSKARTAPPPPLQAGTRTPPEAASLATGTARPGPDQTAASG